MISRRLVRPTIRALESLSISPRVSLPLPLDSLFLTFLMKPEGELGEVVSLGGDRLPLSPLSMLARWLPVVDGEPDRSGVTLGLPLAASSAPSSFWPLKGTGRERLSWMERRLRGTSGLGGSSSSLSCKQKKQPLRPRLQLSNYSTTMAR